MFTNRPMVTVFCCEGFTATGAHVYLAGANIAFHSTEMIAVYIVIYCREFRALLARNAINIGHALLRPLSLFMFNDVVALTIGYWSRGLVVNGDGLLVGCVIWLLYTR